MTLRVVIDTNIWIRILLRGRVTLPILEAFNQDTLLLTLKALRLLQAAPVVAYQSKSDSTLWQSPFQFFPTLDSSSLPLDDRPSSFPNPRSLQHRRSLDFEDRW